ncbi:MAG: hypothetical protein U0640_14235 [Phycisphaerales bacterium]
MKKKHVILVLLGVCVTWLVLGFGPMVFNSKQDAAAMGDTFGIVNALFSGLALAGVIIALRFQSDELSLQREELRLTRNELARQSEAQQQSQQSLAEQVKMMTESSRINALSIIIQSADAELNSSAVSPSRRDVIIKARSAALKKLQGIWSNLDEEENNATK